MTNFRSLGADLMNLANGGFSNLRLREILWHETRAELARRAAPPPIGQPGAAAALLRQAAHQQMTKGKSQ